MKYYVAHNNEDVFHYGKLEEGQVMDTGQPYVEEFETELEMISFLTVKGVEHEKEVQWE